MRSQGTVLYLYVDDVARFPELLAKAFGFETLAAYSSSPQRFRRPPAST